MDFFKLGKSVQLSSKSCSFICMKCIYMYICMCIPHQYCWYEKVSEKILMLLFIIMKLYNLFYSLWLYPVWICLWFIQMYICLHFSVSGPSAIFAFYVKSPLVGKQARGVLAISLQSAVWFNQDNDFLPQLILQITFTCCKVGNLRVQTCF